MTDTADTMTDLETTFPDCLPDLIAGQGLVAAKMVEKIIEYLDTIESIDDEMETMDQFEKIRKIMSRMVYSNSLSANYVLDMILKVQKPEILQVLLNVLPSLMEQQEIDSASEPIVSVLLDTLHRVPAARLPVLGCLSVLPLTGEARKASFQQALKSLLLVDESDWPLLIRIVIRSVSEKSEAMMLWSTIRAQCCNEMEMTYHLMFAAQYMFDGFCQDQKRALLVTTFLHNVKESEDIANLLDAILLLGLSNEHEDSIDKIFDSWLMSGSFPFALCEALVEQIGDTNRLEMPSGFHQRIVDGFLRLAIFLLLVPARIPHCDTQPIIALVLQMVKNLDRTHQDSLLSSMVHLSEEVDGLSLWKTEITKRPNESSVPLFRLVNDVLKHVVQQLPDLLVAFKGAFMRRLSCDFGADKPALASSVEDICSILVAIVEASQADFQELTNLLQRMLFSSTGGISLSSGNSTLVISGLVLARTLVDTTATSNSELEHIKEWVQAIILPSSRRTATPEVGRAALMVLRALANRGASDNSPRAYFDQIKMVLGNTGLVQKVSQYKATRNCTLAYYEVPAELATYTPDLEYVNLPAQDLVFCVDYFQTRTNVADPIRWESTCLWVFELVDTYIMLARENSKKDWNAEVWLQASIQFSNFAFPSVSSTVDAALADANDYSLQLQMQEMESEQVEGKQTQDFLRVLYEYETTLLIGISLSLAVLKNASEHFASTLDPEKINLSKSSKVLGILRALKISPKRKRQDTDKLFKLDRRRIDSTGDEHEVQSIVQAGAMVDGAAQEIDKVHLILFSDPCLSPIFLWQIYQEHLVDNTFLNVLKQESAVRGHLRPFDMTMVSFQCTLLDELAHVSKRFTLSSSQGGNSTFQGLIRSMSSVVNFYDQIRHKKLDSSINSQLHEIAVQLARAYCKLVSEFLTDSELVVESIPTQQSMAPSNSREEKGGASGIVNLFELIASQVQNTEDVGIAHFQLNILARLVTRADVRYVDKVTEISWSTLHAVFSGSLELTPEDWGGCLSHMAQGTRLIRPAGETIPLGSILEAALLSSRSNLVKKSAPFCLAVIRHLALISHAGDRLLRYSKHIVKFVEEIELLAAALHSTIRGEKVEIDGEQRSTRAIPASCFPFLNSASLPDFWHTLLSMTTLITGRMDSALTTAVSDNDGPYNHLKFLFGVFRRLLNIFRDNFAIFPSRSTRAIANISRDFLEMMMVQLRRCVDWRNRQPILAVAQRTTTVDVGSLAYLDELMHEHMSPVIGDVSLLCDFFVEKSDGPYFPFKRTNLRATIEKTGREIRKVAAVHNLSSPALLPRKLPNLDDFATPLSQNQDADTDTDGDKEPMPLLQTTRSDGEASVFMSASDDDSSFGVSGVWGGSDDESFGDTGCQPTSLIKRS